MKGNSSSEGLRATLASAWCDSAGQRLPGQKQAADIPAGKHQPPCSATPGHIKHITVQNASPSSVAQAAGGDVSLHGDVMSPKPECFLLPCGPAELRKLHPHSLSAFLKDFLPSSPFRQSSQTGLCCFTADSGMFL